MKSSQGNESWRKTTQRLRYLEYLSDLLSETYASLKEMKTVPQARKSFIEGVMSAAQFLGVTKNELEKLIEKVNHDVFGMSIEERRKVFKEIPPSEDTQYDIPTYVRKGKILII